MSRGIADTYEGVYDEDYAAWNMVRNRCISKPISDIGWNAFDNMIAYKAEGAGGRLLKVDPRKTTQNCPHCGEHGEKSRADRIHECPYCGLKKGRDLYAALNILRRRREIWRGPPESRTAKEKVPKPSSKTVKAYSEKQEASPLVRR